MIHVVGSAVNLLQEGLQLLDEDALLEPLNHSKCQTRAGLYLPPENSTASGPTWLPL